MGRVPETADQSPLPEQHDSSVQGLVVVTYPGKPFDSAAVRRRLARFFTPREANLADPPIFEEPAESWLESDPVRRLEHFRAAVAPEADDDAWQERPMHPILEATVQGMQASIQESDALPFHLITFEFDLRVSTSDEDPNAAGHLTSVAQACRDLTESILGDARSTIGQIVAVTSQPRTQEEMRLLRQQVDELRSLGLDEDSAAPKDAVPELEMPPLGGRGSGGFSHARPEQPLY